MPKTTRKCTQKHPKNLMRQHLRTTPRHFVTVFPSLSLAPPSSAGSFLSSFPITIHRSSILRLAEYRPSPFLFPLLPLSSFLFFFLDCLFFNHFLVSILSPVCFCLLVVSSCRSFPLFAFFFFYPSLSLISRGQEKDDNDKSPCFDNRHQPPSHYHSEPALRLY